MRNRAFLSLGIAATAGLLAIAPAQAQDSVTLANYGGAWATALSQAELKPIEKMMGITIKEVTINSMSEVKLQVDAGAVEIDIADLGTSECIAGVQQNLWEPLDYNVISTDGIDPNLVTQYWVGGPSYYSTVMAWNTETYGDKAPQTWADFWDVEKFPGTRALWNFPVTSMEFALLADGVPPDQLYPIDVERAFNKLRELKPHVAVWWTNGAQAAQLLNDGEVDMLSIWNGRATTAIKNGAKGAFTFNQGLLDADCMVVPKGSKKKDLAMKVINLILSPDLQAGLPALIDYGPINMKAFDTGKISEADARASNSSPENAKVQILLRADWWGENLATIQPMWDAFVQE
ncbi:MAG TPA: ABC transporter substrate-binding protein [Kiloniellales bacterium]|nr:ABC transporter substrate-binding protein [Kiloniellales bacterium]